MTREEAIKHGREQLVIFGGEHREFIEMAIKALEQEDITWIVGNDNVQIAVRNMPVDMMQKINAIIGNKQEPTTKNETLVSLGAYKQVAWERDIAIQQLHELGYEFGQKIEPTTKNDLGVDVPDNNVGKIKDNLGVDYLGVDCISRADVLQVMQDNWHIYNGDLAMQESMDDIRALPSVTPQEPRCKNCKWWKDSDGEYRRGCGAESQCPINRKEVYEGDGYCFLYELQESEG